MEEIKNRYFWLFPVYFVSVGILYLWAYWYTFNINIFEYANLLDIVKASLIPVGTPFFLILIVMFICEFTFFYQDSEDHVDSLTRSSLIIPFLGILVLIFTVLFSVEMRWKALPWLLGIIPYLVLKRSSFFSEITQDSVRSVLILAVSTLPIYSFCIGKTDANKVIEGKYVNVTVEEIAGYKDLKYIGNAGEMLFFISQKNTEIVLRKIDDNPLVLRLPKALIIN